MHQYLDFANELADAAGAIALHHFRKPVTVDIKPDQSPVSAADREIEQMFRARVQAAFPDHGILGEEFESAYDNADHVWVIDPIDGTRAFLAGKPTFTILIALCFQETPILGIADQPFTHERYSGAMGSNSRFNGKPMRTRKCSELKTACLATTSPDYFGVEQRPKFRALTTLVQEVQYGGDGYNYAQLAAGRLDVVAEAELKPYDILAFRPIIEGAGGIITHWDGAPLTLTHCNTALATGDAAVHAAALKYLR
jgi:inositol-phosphate phosphatase/L-galactose 1-phosphate phosphatase/histidinol-phosphatase